jgi:hypothetical protein
MTLAQWNAAGQIMALVGVVILFRYGMPFRVNAGGGDMVTTNPTEANIRQDKLHWWLGLFGLALVLIGGAIQVVLNFLPPIRTLPTAAFASPYIKV